MSIENEEQLPKEEMELQERINKLLEIFILERNKMKKGSPPKTGICGINENKKPIFPKGVNLIDFLVPLATSEDIYLYKDKLIKRKLISKQKPDELDIDYKNRIYQELLKRLKDEDLIPKNANSFYMYHNPSPEILKERSQWGSGW
ncbi:MAG: hypothetical protein AAB732_00710 [Patescibacteria group bacterium]